MNSVRIALVVILAAPMLHAQMGCSSQIRPIQPPSAGPSAALLCLCAQNNISCRWQWAAPPAGQPVQAPYAVQAPPYPAAQAPYPPPVQSDTSIYRITPPPHAQPMSPLDMAIKAEQIRALRLENQQRQQEIQRDTQSSAFPAIIPTGPATPDFPLATAYATMPYATHSNKRDQKNWEKWLAQQDPSVRTLLPPWSPAAYEIVRTMAAEQVLGTTTPVLPGVPSSKGAGLVLAAPNLREGADSFPARWKSLTSATTKIIRREEERIYVETILPDAQKQAGCFTVADLRKQGSIFAGPTKSSCVCQYGANKTNRYSHDFPMEITMVSPTRIEGRILQPVAGARFDCKRDTYSGSSDWVSFAWIPE